MATRGGGLTVKVVARSSPSIPDDPTWQTRCTPLLVSGVMKCTAINPRDQMNSSAVGHERRFRDACDTSAEPPRADVKADIPVRQLRANSCRGHFRGYDVA